MKDKDSIQAELKMILLFIKRFMGDNEISLESKKTAAIEIASTAVDTATGINFEEGILLFEEVENEIQNRRNVI